MYELKPVTLPDVSPITFASKCRIERQTDFFLLHFSAGEGQDGPVVALPLTAGIDLCLGMFEAMVESMLELQLHFTGLQGRINSLNELAQSAAKRAAAKAAQGTKK